MAVAGLSNYRSDHALAITNMALDMQKSVLSLIKKYPVFSDSHEY
jgi:adenylate cyclase